MGLLEKVGREQGRTANNKLGQVIGRKGAATRQRLLKATRRLLVRHGQMAKIRVSDIVTKAKVSQATFYSYFSNVEDAVFDVVRDVTIRAPDIVNILQEEWPADEVYMRCEQVVQAYMEFWQQHGAILWLRNAEADQGNLRFLDEHHSVVMPVVNAIAEKIRRDAAMNAHSHEVDPLAAAAVLLACFERVASTQFRVNLVPGGLSNTNLLEGCAHLMFLTVTGGRGAAAAAVRQGASRRKPAKARSPAS